MVVNYQREGRKANYYTIDFDRLEAQIDKRTKMIMMCNPHSGRPRMDPRGAKLADIARHGLIVVSDEITRTSSTPEHQRLHRLLSRTWQTRTVTAYMLWLDCEGIGPKNEDLNQFFLKGQAAHEHGLPLRAGGHLHAPKCRLPQSASGGEGLARIEKAVKNPRKLIVESTDYELEPNSRRAKEKGYALAPGRGGNRVLQRRIPVTAGRRNQRSPLAGRPRERSQAVSAAPRVWLIMGTENRNRPLSPPRTRESTH